ncbi:YkvA family protein [Sphaerotilus hippei]|nr:YkvA family protein [Sphaerotilus hippei]
MNLKRLAVMWSALSRDARVLWQALKHPQAPGWLKVCTVLLVGYVLSPIDLIPDFLAIFGWVDDLLIVGFSLRWLLSRLPVRVREDAERAAFGHGATVVEVVDRR